jgi:redox-sensitive bicupin YhaK (pirin superfamily)
MEKQISLIHAAGPRQRHSPAQENRLIVAPDDFSATSPFLFLAEDWFAPPAGFPTHPHRGIQTVTIVLEGSLEHRDHTGGHGALEAGDVQWMTAGRGVLHSEMPGPKGVHSLQLWLNLPKSQKMVPAAYADQKRGAAPLHLADGAEARIYAGRLGDIAQPHGSLWPLTLLDVRVDAGRSITLPLPAADRAFVYVLDGSSNVGRAGQVAWLLPGGDEITIRANTPFRGIVFSSPPIDEPVVARGPFVMNTENEIRQAFEDYRNDRLVEPA